MGAWEVGKSGNSCNAVNLVITHAAPPAISLHSRHLLARGRAGRHRGRGRACSSTGSATTHGLALLAPYLAEIKGRWPSRASHAWSTRAAAPRAWDGGRLWSVAHGTRSRSACAMARDCGTSTVVVRHSPIACLAAISRAPPIAGYGHRRVLRSRGKSVAPFGVGPVFTPNPSPRAFHVGRSHPARHLRAADQQPHPAAVRAGSNTVVQWMMQERPPIPRCCSASQRARSCRSAGSIRGHKGLRARAALVEPSPGALAGFGHPTAEGWGATVFVRCRPAFGAAPASRARSTGWPTPAAKTRARPAAIPCACPAARHAAAARWSAQERCALPTASCSSLEAWAAEAPRHSKGIAIRNPWSMRLTALPSTRFNTAGFAVARIRGCPRRRRPPARCLSTGPASRTVSTITGVKAGALPRPPVDAADRDRRVLVAAHERLWPGS